MMLKAVLLCYFLRRAAARPMRPMPKSAIVPGSGTVDVVVLDVLLLVVLDVLLLLEDVPRSAYTSSKPSDESRPVVLPDMPKFTTMYR